MTSTVVSSSTSSPVTSTSSTSISTTVVSSSTSSGFKLATPTKTGTTGALASATGMADAAEAIGRYFGTAADIPGTGEASDPYYLAVFNNSHNFDQVTPANVMKWDSLEPQQNVFNYAGADQFVALAEATDKIIRCHNLNWYNQLPSCESTLRCSLPHFFTMKTACWRSFHQAVSPEPELLEHLLTILLIASGITNPSTPWTNDTLMAALENHIDKVMGHFGDACYHWVSIDTHISCAI